MTVAHLFLPIHEFITSYLILQGASFLCVCLAILWSKVKQQVYFTFPPQQHILTFHLLPHCSVQPSGDRKEACVILELSQGWCLSIHPHIDSIGPIFKHPQRHVGRKEVSQLFLHPGKYWYPPQRYHWPNWLAEISKCCWGKWKIERNFTPPLSFFFTIPLSCLLIYLQDPYSPVHWIQCCPADSLPRTRSSTPNFFTNIGGLAIFSRFL